MKTKIYREKTDLDPGLLKDSDLLFDIETTGLSKYKNKIILIGCGFISDGYLNIRQFFAENENEEGEVLKRFYEDTAEFDRLITYNGDRFDIPFINERTSAHSLDVASDSFSSLDIYKNIKPYKLLLGLPSLKQKNIENFLGIERDDEIDGGESVKLYKTYEKSHDPDLEDTILLHNHDDVKGLLDILPILEYRKLSRLSLFPIRKDISKDQIIFECESNAALPEEVSLSSHLMTLRLMKNRVKGVIHFIDGAFPYFQEDISQYLYHIEEKTIIPRVLVPKTDLYKYRLPSKEECFIKILPENVTDEMINKSVMNLIENYI